MEINDLEEVIALDQASFTLPWPESSFKFEIEKNLVSRCWVAEAKRDSDSPAIVAMIVIWLIEDEAHIATFAVHPDFRRLKVGQRLLAFSLLDAHRSGATRSFLEVRSANLAARNLYQLFGFQEIGVRKRYYQDNGEDAIMMNLEKINADKLESLQ